jgi:DNA-binding NarL/FixJ family response regulator
MNILIIEDHPITSLGLKNIIESNFKVKQIDITVDGKSSVKMAKKNNYNLITLDIVLPDTDTQSLLGNLKRITPTSEILIVSNKDPKVYAMSYISSGASGYIKKTEKSRNIVTAINTILQGQIYLSKEVFINNLNNNKCGLANNSPTSKLSDRELEVFRHLLNGDRIKDISMIMNIHQSTASTLKKRIMKKFDVDNLIDLKIKANLNNEI